MSTRIQTKTIVTASSECDSKFHKDAPNAIDAVADNYIAGMEIETFITVTFKCDKDEKQLAAAYHLDGQPTPGRHAYEESEIAVDRAERLARSSGWFLSRTGDDLCPDCAKEAEL